MGTSLEMPEDIEFDKMCRCCMSKKGEMRALYGSCLDDMLRIVAQVEVEAADGLPELMCFQCVLQVSRAFRFKQQCERTDKIFRSYISNKQSDHSENTIKTITFTSDNKQDNGVEILTRPKTPVAQAAIEHVASSNFKNTFEIQIVEDFNFGMKADEFNDITLSSCLETLQDSNEDEEASTPSSLNESMKVDVGISEHIDTHFPPLPDAQKPKPDLFECNHCKKTFAKKQILSRHLKIHNPIKPHVCNDCGMAFTESSNLTKHQKKHTGELRNVVGKPNVCKVCGKGFKWASSLSKHRNHHTKRKILNCPHCPKYYLESQTLKLHMRTHTGERPFICNICDKSFTQMCNLEKHLRIHTGEKPYECPICRKSFTQSGYIAIHMRSHTGEKPYMCNVCGKCFAGSNTLAMHKRIHTGEKPYSCNVCGKAFARLETATVHQRTHTGEKPHYCTICNRAFISSSHLSNHKRTHTGVKPYNCEQCKKNFSSSSSYKIHLKSHYKAATSRECKTCSKTFTDSTELVEHELMHSANIVFGGDKP